MKACLQLQPDVLLQITSLLQDSTNRMRNLHQIVMYYLRNMCLPEFSIWPSTLSGSFSTHHSLNQPSQGGQKVNFFFAENAVFGPLQEGQILTLFPLLPINLQALELCNFAHSFLF